MANCSRDRWSTVCFTLARSAFNGSDDVEGGGPGSRETTSAGVMVHAFTLPKFMSNGGRMGDSWLSQEISPLDTAASDRDVHIAGLPGAAPMPSALARAITSAATALPSARP